MAESWRDLRFAPVVRRLERRRGRGNAAVEAVIEGGASDFGLDPRSLVRFVLIARVDLLSERSYDGVDGWVVLPEGERLKREELADRIGWSRKDLSQLLGQSEEYAGGHEKRGYSSARIGQRLRTTWAAVRHSSRFDALSSIARLEADLQMFAIRERNATPEALHAPGSMTGFWQEMLGSGETMVSPNVNTARWFRDLGRYGPRNSAEALVAGEALLSVLAAARDRNDAERLVAAQAEQVNRCVRALMTVATNPPARGAIPATHLLAQLGALPVLAGRGTVADLAVQHVQESPVGFRAIRVLTRIAALSMRRYGLLPAWWSDNGADERTMVWNALEAIRPHRDRDPYPARSLWVESLRAIRLSKDAGYTVEALRLLEERARTHGRPTRERAYAAYCVYLALQHNDPARIEALLTDLRAGDDTGDEVDEGLTYAADVIEMLLEAGRSELTLEALLLHRHDPGDELPAEELTAPERFSLLVAVGIVDDIVFHGGRPGQSVGTELLLQRLPLSIRSATQSLVRYALLSIDGSARRRAAEALREAGVANEAACLMIEVLDHANSPRWLKEHASFLLGYLTDPVAIDPLVGEIETSDHQSIQHAALWALGDIAHPDAVAAKAIMAAATAKQQQVRITRAAAYALAASFPEPDPGTAGEVHAALEQLAVHADDLTASLARWGLRERARTARRAETSGEVGVWGMRADLAGEFA